MAKNGPTTAGRFQPRASDMVPLELLSAFLYRPDIGHRRVDGFVLGPDPAIGSSQPALRISVCSNRNLTPGADGGLDPTPSAGPRGPASQARPGPSGPAVSAYGRHGRQRQSLTRIFVQRLLRPRPRIASRLDSRTARRHGTTAENPSTRHPACLPPDFRFWLRIRARRGSMAHGPSPVAHGPMAQMNPNCQEAHASLNPISLDR